MLGALAVAESETLVVDTAELESARWVELSAISDALDAADEARAHVSAPEGLVLPAPLAIAHHLLRTCTQIHRHA